MLRRVLHSFVEDRIRLVSAGASFFLLLALLPALAAFVAIYGVFADPATVAGHIQFLSGFMPQGGVEIIGNQMKSLASKRPESLSIGAIVGLAASLWTTNNGIKAMFEGLNIVYGERETRGTIKLYLHSFAFTICTFLFSIVVITAVGLVPPALTYMNVDRDMSMIIETVRWSVLLVCVGGGILLLYRFGPSHPRADWRWLARGALLATTAWMLASWAFSLYLQNFSRYDATFGTLGAAIGFMIWMWISVLIILVGAALNAEIERQSMKRTGKSQASAG